MSSTENLSLASPMAVVEQTNPGQTILYSYWRSSCSWRVRIALYWKGIPFDYRTINLLQAEQQSDDYARLNPNLVLPTLIIDNQVLTQSIAILEYLEERRPESWRLLPVEAHTRAQVRAIVQLIASDIQPIQNLRVLKKVGDAGKSEWAQHWIHTGFTALEQILKQTAGKFCVGDTVSMADVCLVPQVYNARRFNIDVDAFPTIARIDRELSQLEAFQRAHPDNQPDAVKQ